MKTITKEFNLLDIEDIEEALSACLEKEIAISDVECTMWRSVTEQELLPQRIILAFITDEMSCDDEPIYSFEIFSKEKDGFYWKGKRLALNEPYLPVEQIFNFDVSKFKAFCIMTEYEAE